MGGLHVASGWSGFYSLLGDVTGFNTTTVGVWIGQAPRGISLKNFQCGGRHC